MLLYPRHLGFDDFVRNQIIPAMIGVRFVKGKRKKGCNKGKRFVAQVVPTTERRIANAALDSIAKAMPWLMLD